MKRAAIITVDMGDEREATLRVGVYFGPDSDEAAHSGAVADEVYLVEPSEQLLADLRTVHNLALIGLGEQYGVVDTDPLARAIARVRAALGEEAPEK